MELAGAAYPQAYKGEQTEPLVGLSLVPTFRNRDLARDTLFFEMGGNRAIRTLQWKAVTRRDLPGEFRDQVRIPIEYWELYDMRNDRTETKNLANKNAAVLEKLIERWEDWIVN